MPLIGLGIRGCGDAFTAVRDNPSVDISDVPAEIVRDLCVRTPINHRTVDFITLNELTTDERAVTPDLWMDALTLSGRAGVAVLLDEWERILPDRLPRTIARFRDAGTDLILGRQLGFPVLIYVLEGNFGRDRYCPWVARPPQAVSAVPRYLRQLPGDVIALHTRLHDSLESPLTGGPLPMAEMELVSDYYDPGWPFELWSRDESSAELLVTTPPPAEQPDWSRVAIVHNALPQKICAVLSDDRANTAGWYWVEGSMWPQKDIWGTMDDWLQHGASDWHHDEIT